MKTCVIVDPYRFSEDYIKYLRKKKVLCIHVQSTKEPLRRLHKYSSYDSSDYIRSYNLNSNEDIDIKGLVEDLKQYNPEAVIAGAEIGVLLADKLSNLLNKKSNNIAKSKARRNKLLMIEELKNNNIPHMKYLMASSLDEAIKWIDISSSYPVILKPMESASSDHVFICNKVEVLEKRFYQILNEKTVYNMKNEGVLVEEFLQGTEYMLNSVVCNGEVYFTDIWECKKRFVANSIIYDRETLLDGVGLIQDLLKEYVSRVIKALGINYGATHAEVMLTDHGPILIEIGARVGGNINCLCHDLLLDSNQIELTVDAYVDEESFLLKTKNPYIRKKHAITTFLSTEKNGIVLKAPILDIIESCESVAWKIFLASPGTRVTPTRDLTTCVGKLILIHENKDVVERDYNRITQGMATDGLIVKDDSL